MQGSTHVLLDLNDDTPLPIFLANLHGAQYACVPLGRERYTRQFETHNSAEQQLTLHPITSTHVLFKEALETPHMHLGRTWFEVQ